ncbi:MAG: DUF1847 domain-containing protein [Coriobacteriia bacterium]|nr:DUF1847 domain-containing protein [Coriobacteriia bacterium]
METKNPSCVDCKVLACETKKGNYPAFCPTAHAGEQRAEDIAQRYGEDDLPLRVMHAAYDVLKDSRANRWCRVEEMMALFRHLGFTRIGIASCTGLHEEASLFADILRAHGFEPYGTCCKVGGVPRSRFGVFEDACDVDPVSCNPLMQAQLLEEAGTEVNVVVGLCVGHDMLFSMYSKAPVVTLIAKDRALAHNPAGALYAAKGDSHYRRLLHP